MEHLQSTSQKVSNEETTSKPQFSKIIDGTPFALIHENGNYCLALGHNQLTPWLPSEETCIEYMKDDKWTFLASVITCIVKFELTNKTNN